MTKLKTARLSLTVPGSLDLPDDQFAEEGVDANVRPESNPRQGASSEPRIPGFIRNEEPLPSPRVSPDMSMASSFQSPASPTSPSLTSLPPIPSSPTTASKASRDNSKSFFLNLKASKSSAKIQPADATIRKVPQERSMQEDIGLLPFRTKSTPDLRSTSSSEPIPDLPDLNDSQSNPVNTASLKTRTQRRPIGGQTTSISVTRSNAVGTNSPGPASPTPESQEIRKNSRLFQSFMRRNYSNREDVTPIAKPPTPTFGRALDGPTAKPPSRDRSIGRNSSPNIEGDEGSAHDRMHTRATLRDQRSQSFREGAGGSIFNGLRQTTARAAEGFGKAHTRLFKQSKQPTPHAKALTEYSPNYEPKVINLPLIEQTRVTRIARRLEDSKDKTEFWMPALPWRCIDFLNYTGCETEGLYRVPGSDKEVRIWKQRFDQEFDVNLFEEDDLYDVNTIGSLFKAWLRELPEEVFPQPIQDRLSERHASEEKAPPALLDALSNLPPWNYYLLFAITCHLSLLNAYSDKNKMSYHNLYVCFAPALKMNGDCFRWLVADWRNCWKGCLTEKAALEQEYRLLDSTGHPTGLQPGLGIHDQIGLASTKNNLPRTLNADVPLPPPTEPSSHYENSGQGKTEQAQASTSSRIHHHGSYEMRTDLTTSSEGSSFSVTGAVLSTAYISDFFVSP